MYKYPDGCIKPNIPTKPYRVTYMPTCGHGRVLHVQIDVRGTSEESALAYAARNYRFPHMVAAIAVEITLAEIAT